ncbi:MAG: prepilin-type N-terminal cleavage/methylation domain-containing protein [Planctomycetes bacterium]|nr:prepilin-type N-terminal cleavage/methylation domain-containing protein [Planctomycetota bacterium]
MRTRSPSRRNASRRGFTVLEVILAFAILLVGLVSIYALFARGLVSHKRAVDYTIAGQLAASVFEDISANYQIYYYDMDLNGRPDLSEDRNFNGVDDWFEPDQSGQLPYPIPRHEGYRFKIEYVHPADKDMRQSIFVTLRVYWLNAGEQRSEVFERAVYVRYMHMYFPTDG